MTEIPSPAIASLEQGNKIEAIKIVREAFRLGLKDSKEFVEKYLSEHDGLAQRFNAIQAENNRKGLQYLALFILIIIAAYYFLSGTSN
jgi:ribosomal protein L7/L12